MALIKYRIEDENWDYFGQIQFFFQSFKIYRTDVNDLIEDQIHTASESYTEFIAKRVEENDFTPDLEWFEHHEAINVGTNLRDIYYDSMIIVLYSFLERKLNFLCRYLEKDYPTKIDNIAGKGIFKYKKFLSKVAGIVFDEVEEKWKEIEKLNRLRNYVVHSEGSRSVLKTNQSFIAILTSIPGIMLDDSDKTYIRFHFLDDTGVVYFEQMVRSVIDFVYCKKV